MFPICRGQEFVRTVAVYVAASVAMLLGLALMQSQELKAEPLGFVEMEGKQGALMQAQIESVLQNNGYEILVVDERGQSGDVRTTIVATLERPKKKWVLVVQVWNGSQGEMRYSSTFRARRPKTLAKIVKRKLWKRIGSEIEAAEPDPPVVTEEEVATESTRDVNPIAVAKKELAPAKSDSGRAWPFDAEFTLGTQIFSRRFGYTGTPQALALFSAPTVIALHIEGEIFPVPDFGIIAGYGFGPSSDSAVEGMSEISFPTSSRNFQLGAIARRTFGKFTPRAQLEYGGQNFTVKGGLPLPNVRYRFLRMGVGIKAKLLSRLSLGLSAGYRHLLSSGEIESSEYFPRLSGRALDASAHVDVKLIPHWYLRVIASTTEYSSALNTETGDMLIAEEANDRYRALQLSLGYRL